MDMRMPKNMSTFPMHESDRSYLVSCPTKLRESPKIEKMGGTTAVKITMNAA